MLLCLQIFAQLLDMGIDCQVKIPGSKSRVVEIRLKTPETGRRGKIIRIKSKNNKVAASQD